MLRRLSPHAPCLIACLAVAARLLPGPRTIDDAFITFRYARNLVEGIGFVYNPGEHVLGTTTPLYTLLMAALAALFRTGDYPALAFGLNALADGATCALLVPLGERLSGHRSVGMSAGLLWALAPMSVTFAIGGMETSVFILLTTATFALYLWDRTRPAALAAGLALLARPDALLFVGPLILDLLVRRIRARRPAGPRLPFPWAETGVFLGAVVPWAVFAAFYYGSVITHSVAAKTVAYRLPPGSALVRLLQNFSAPFFENLLLPNGTLLISLLIVYLSLAVIGGLHAIRRDSRAWPLAAYPLIYFVAFAAANPLIFRWYLAPPLPAYFILILCGLVSVGEGVRGELGRERLLVVGDWGLEIRALKQAGNPPSPNLQSLATSDQPPATSHQPPATNNQSPITIILLLPVFLLLSLNAWSVHPDHGPDRPAPRMAWHQLELLYEQVGRELSPQVGPDTVIAAGDVGALGYYSGARILDTVGLMSPEAVRYYPLPESAYVINYAIAPDLILDERPDFVVILEVYGREGLLRDPRFAREYTLVERIPTDIYGSEGMLVYRSR